MSGLAAGLGVGALLEQPTAARLLLGGVTMAAAYVPDLDHAGSTVSRFFPPLTRPLSWLARLLSRRVYAATKGPADEDHNGEHRHLLHSILFSMLLGAVVGGLALVGAGRVGLADPVMWGWLAGGGLALGCVVHILGDALTLSGVSGMLWPLPIAGETFYEVRLPAGLRFRTGGLVEQLLVFPALCVGVVLAAPGMWSIVSAALRV